jgi:lipooligosaccharide transport system permease protein
MKSENGFALLFRLGLIPMFLFSGAFFPITQLGAFAWLAYVTPIWHGVDLTRMLTAGDLETWRALGHVAYIGAWIVAGWFFAVSGFRKRLTQ